MLLLSSNLHTYQCWSLCSIFLLACIIQPVIMSNSDGSVDGGSLARCSFRYARQILMNSIACDCILRLASGVQG
jgi:hypothetical protein